MFGSLGWGLAMFFVGIALDQADVFADHPCGYKQKVCCCCLFFYDVSCLLLQVCRC